MARRAVGGVGDEAQRGQCIRSIAVRRPREPLRLGLCILVVLLGVSVIIGWLENIERLKSIAPTLTNMKFNTAVGFVLTGSGLAAAEYRSNWARWVAISCGIALLALGGATLSQYATGVDLGIDELIVADREILRGTIAPGRMSWLTATAWTTFGIALISLAAGYTRKIVATAHFLIAYGGVVSVLAAGGYTFGAEQFWGIGIYTQIAVHTAAGLLVATAAGMMTRAGDGWFEPFRDSPAAQSLLVRLFPLSLLVPISLGLLLMLGAGLGAFNAAYAFAVFIPATSIAMMAGSLWIARQHRAAELQRLQYERHLQLVVGELNHRVKNMLSIVQSLAHQSLTDRHFPEDAKAAFSGRLEALATAHDMLTRQNWDRLPIDQLLKAVLAAHDNDGGRFELDGPSIDLSPKASVTLAIAAHELATNATKYGALSSADGRVGIRWHNGDGGFHFNWREFGGPPPKQKISEGFGSKMLKRALAVELGGKALLEFSPDGLNYELRCPAGI